MSSTITKRKEKKKEKQFFYCFIPWLTFDYKRLKFRTKSDQTAPTESQADQNANEFSYLKANMQPIEQSMCHHLNFTLHILSLYFSDLLYSLMVPNYVRVLSSVKQAKFAGCPSKTDFVLRALKRKLSSIHLASTIGHQRCTWPVFLSLSCPFRCTCILVSLFLPANAT